MHTEEIAVLRSERNSFMNTISKLHIELTRAAYQHIIQKHRPGKNGTISLSFAFPAFLFCDDLCAPLHVILTISDVLILILISSGCLCIFNSFDCEKLLSIHTYSVSFRYLYGYFLQKTREYHCFFRSRSAVSLWRIPLTTMMTV